MTIAEETRQAVRRRPFLLDALRAGVLNYTAAARYLDIGDEDAVAAALRRLANGLPSAEESNRNVRIRILSSQDEPSARLQIGDVTFEPAGREHAAISVEGGLDAAFIGAVYTRLGAEGLSLEASGRYEDRWLFFIERRAVPDVIRILEETEAMAPSGRLPTD